MYIILLLLSAAVAVIALAGALVARRERLAADTVAREAQAEALRQRDERARAEAELLSLIHI